ncbi:MAG TPA: ribonuclease P protein component [Chitinophagaceae bacterium]|nr:ribonuclease P protein component [Chitinophagaceae bacterium]
MKQFTLSRHERLKSRKQIDKLFSEGRYINLPPLRVGYILEDGGAQDQLQLGVGVSGRFFKKAVDRNRVKRLLRESWRLQKTELADLAKQRRISLKVFIIYTGRELPEYKHIFGKVGSAISQLRSLFNEKDPADT